MIRKAENKDIPQIMGLLTQVNMVHHNIRPDLFAGPATKYTSTELQQIIQCEDTPVFVHTDVEDMVDGYAFCMFIQHKNHNILTDIKTLYIDDLCVDETKRRHKIGESLYDYVIAFAKAQGCYNVTLNVWAGNDSAIAFYQKNGMKQQKIGMETIL